MWSFIKSIPAPVKWIGGIILVLALVAVYQWGYINGEKKCK